MEALLESQEPQISLNRKAMVIEACGESPVTTADEKENHRQQVFAIPHLLYGYSPQRIQVGLAQRKPCLLEFQESQILLNRKDILF